MTHPERMKEEGGRMKEESKAESEPVFLHPSSFRLPPSKQGLYDPVHEHDACGVGFVVDMRGRKSHAIVDQALTAVCCLNHRGAAGAEADTGDGAGITVQVPDRFYREILDFVGERLHLLNGSLDYITSGVNNGIRLMLKMNTRLGAVPNVA